jgi:hypothetical protein
MQPELELTTMLRPDPGVDVDIAGELIGVVDSATPNFGW